MLGELQNQLQVLGAVIAPGEQLDGCCVAAFADPGGAQPSAQPHQRRIPPQELAQLILVGREDLKPNLEDVTEFAEGV
jgi:hypothetical protein